MDGPVGRLTSLAHGGGCGCKLAPSVLRDLLSGMPFGSANEQLVVGTETGDDAAVWALDETDCVVATTDFFMPMVDDPRDFGRIAATNAISDIYAMGAKPIFALAICGMPIDLLPTETIRAILEGGASICSEAGIPIAGGHSIDSVEPIYGLAVIGTVARADLKRNSDARHNDVLLLTKPLGVGIYSAAFKSDALDPAGYAELIESTTRLNRIGAELAREPSVHSMTDVTGFGLLGHALEMARGAMLTFSIETDAVPLLAQARALAQAGHVTGASRRNWASYETEVTSEGAIDDTMRALLTDPQTSGGLLIACAPDRADAILTRIRSAGFAQAARIGRVQTGSAGVRIV